MVFILRLLLLALFIMGLYWCFKYLFNPQRKLIAALNKKKTIMMDDKTSVHRNLLLAYKGVLFEGEKYMGTTEQSFEIIKVLVWPRDHQQLVGLERADFEEIERLIRNQYPYAEVTWRSPVKEFLQYGQNE